MAKPTHIEDWLVTHRGGQWFGWGGKENIYANLVVLDGGSKPTEQECTDGLAALVTAYEQSVTDANNGKTKLKNLGLTDAEITALTGN